MEDMKFINNATTPDDVLKSLKIVSKFTYDPLHTSGLMCAIIQNNVDLFRDEGLAFKMKKVLNQFLATDPSERASVPVKINIARIERKFGDIDICVSLLLSCVDRHFGHILAIASELIGIYMGI